MSSPMNSPMNSPVAYDCVGKKMKNLAKKNNEFRRVCVKEPGHSENVSVQKRNLYRRTASCWVKAGSSSSCPKFPALDLYDADPAQRTMTADIGPG